MNEKIEKLKANPSFCSAPWVHVHSLPDGNIIPCCIWDYEDYQSDRKKFGNINNSESMLAALNNAGFKELRKKFLNGEHVPGCVRCYDREKYNVTSSMRHWFNSYTIDTEQVEQNILQTKDDGTIDNVNIRYVDIRFGNICNLKCRMCSHGLSSTWYEETGDLPDDLQWGGRSKTKFVHTDCYDKLDPYLKDVKEIYFAGGEPFLYPEHLKILDRLVELGNTNCVLKYNTNLTTLKYKGRNFIDVWKNFPNVAVGASIDGMEDTVEYIRTNLVWKEFEENFNLVKTQAPHVHISPSITIGILNIEKFADFEKYCLLNGWHGDRAFSLNYIMDPKYMNIQYLPIWYKQKMIKSLEDHIDWLKEKNITGFHYSKIVELISRLEDNTVSQFEIEEKIKRLKYALDTYDITGNLNWKKSLPHIVEFFDRYEKESY